MRLGPLVLAPEICKPTARAQGTVTLGLPRVPIASSKACAPMLQMNDVFVCNAVSCRKQMSISASTHNSEVVKAIHVVCKTQGRVAIGAMAN